ncbi:hypothetical protein C7E25_01775 [Stenotrophomonas maltophilia]|nr:hypothetical protein C7E25_01775 [Stenotrophomonas maltophilia]
MPAALFIIKLSFLPPVKKRPDRLLHGVFDTGQVWFFVPKTVGEVRRIRLWKSAFDFKPLHVQRGQTSGYTARAGVVTEAHPQRQKRLQADMEPAGVHSVLGQKPFDLRSFQREDPVYHVGPAEQTLKMRTGAQAENLGPGLILHYRYQLINVHGRDTRSQRPQRNRVKVIRMDDNCSAHCCHSP